MSPTTDTGKYRVTPETPDGGDVDLDHEVIIGPDGQRVTEIETQAFTTSRRRAGRPSLGGRQGEAHSPRVAFRVPRTIQERAERQAAAEQVSLSVLARRALERYLDEVAETG